MEVHICKPSTQEANVGPRVPGLSKRKEGRKGRREGRNTEESDPIPELLYPH
jgi:hypothetical protein